MSAINIKKIRNDLGLSQSQFARMVGVASDRTVRRWEEGERDVPGSVILIIYVMSKIPAAKNLFLSLISKNTEDSD